MDKPLRILVILDLPWDIRLGAARVWMELAEQWRNEGHTVEKYCLTDAFPSPVRSAPKSGFRRFRFPFKAAAFVRANANRFDVIDCLIGTLPVPRRRHGFKGVIVARSVGLNLLYARFNSFARQHWPIRQRGTLAGRIFYRLLDRRFARNAEKTIYEADLVNLPNEDELVCFRAEISRDKPVIVEPYGLTKERREDLRKAAAPVRTRWGEKKISFVGMWSERKGARDWGEIVRRIRDAVPGARFAFLGTMIDQGSVLRDLGLDRADFIEVVPQYGSEQLPELLSKCTLGAFPSYLEGFGFGVLEQLAAGVPTIAYDAPGPRTMLKETLSNLLTRVGDPRRFADRVSEILLGEEGSYEDLVRRSIEVSQRFSWSSIARETLQDYRKAIAERDRAGS